MAAASRQRSLLRRQRPLGAIGRGQGQGPPPPRSPRGWATNAETCDCDSRRGLGLRSHDHRDLGCRNDRMPWSQPRRPRSRRRWSTLRLQHQQMPSWPWQSTAPLAKNAERRGCGYGKKSLGDRGCRRTCDGSHVAATAAATMVALGYPSLWAWLAKLRTKPGQL